MPKPEMEFFDVERLKWTPIEGLPGMSERILSKDEETGDYTRLLNFPAGADTSAAGVQRHDFWEEIWIVDGSIHDLTLDEVFTKGMYACRPPRMPHGPWVSPNGCITFEVRYYKRG